MKGLGVYIHIPFCIRKCYYCDFCSFPDGDGRKMRDYTDELCRRIELSPRLRDSDVDTLYFGGGTPTLLPIELFEKIFSAVSSTARIAKEAEITAECNPATADREYLGRLRAMGVNRLSIGLQSVHNAELEALGRLHSFEELKETYAAARAVGFSNISVDLMYGIPRQTKESFRESLCTVAELAPEHISAYALKVERGTRFYSMGESLVLPDEDDECEMYLLMCDLLRKYGYERYEISNFAKEGYRSRHNLKYWRCEDYLGFGVAAHSCCEGERFGNSRDIDGFLRGEDIVSERYTRSERDCLNEYIMLSMRLSEGLSISELEKRTGRVISEVCPQIDTLKKAGYLIERDGRIAFTDTGALVSNSILSDMLEFD